MKTKEIKDLENRVSEIWRYIDNELSEKGQNMVAELIEINILLEQECNQ